jgi:hypothetical protein
MVRGLIWLVLLIGGVVGGVAVVIMGPPQFAVAWGVGTVGVWIAWGVFSSWFWSIRRHLTSHLGLGWRKAEIVVNKIKTGERVNIQAALDHLLEKAGRDRRPFGFPVTNSYSPDDEGPMQYDAQSLLNHNVEPVQIRWESLPCSKDETLSCAENALYLVRAGGHRCGVLVQGFTTQSQKRGVLQVIARDRTAARAALDEILRLSRQRSAYRGAVVSIHKYDRKTEDFAVEFRDLGPVPREAVVLPDEVLRSIELNVLSFFRHAQELRRAGQSSRHGVLLHGPPGTGKTLVTRYLAGAVGAVTVVLLTGKQYAHLKTACVLARSLAPSLVVLEDVDLVAADRRRNPHAPLLHELMDEMDGLGPSADVVFLLTTNRPEVLEPALAGRPGRVDQAIYFPLPDEPQRRRLFGQFGKGLDMSRVDVQPLLARTEGASPAFLKELFRRAALLALERGGHVDSLTMTGEDFVRQQVEGTKRRPVPDALGMTDEDFARALRELLESGGELTRNFLGFPAAKR